MTVVDWTRTWRDKDTDFSNPREDDTINNHLCQGLSDFQRIGGGCTPRIDVDGFISGCDDTNPFRITFCPFCGERIYKEDK